MKGALVGGLIAEIESELLFIENLAGCGVIARGFQFYGAPAEPMVLRDALDERGLGKSFGFVLFTKLRKDFVELGLRFGGEDAEGSGESVMQVVERGGGFPCVGLGS